VHSYRKNHRTTGHVWQGRFKAFPIAEDHHLLSVLRYIERNPLRAGMVPHAEDWPWSSLPARGHLTLLPCLDPDPTPGPPDWTDYVNRPETEVERAQLRYSAWRQAPFGSDSWVKRRAVALGLESSLRPTGHPRRPATRAVRPPIPLNHPSSQWNPECPIFPIRSQNTDYSYPLCRKSCR